MFRLLDESVERGDGATSEDSETPHDGVFRKFGT